MGNNNQSKQECLYAQNNNGQYKKQNIENFQWQEATQMNEEFTWDPFISKFFKFKIKITFTKDKEIIYYSLDGSILRMSFFITKFRDSILDISKKPDVLRNLDQIENLQWQGKYGENKKKIGLWYLVWNGEILKDVGGSYQKDGLKQGLWKQLIKNYWKRAKLYEIGEYFNDHKRGKWKYIYEDKEIGGGLYNEFGEKTGKWIDISRNFWEYKQQLLKSESQILFIGNYINGCKVGRWDINWREQKDSQFIKIGGGSYDNNRQGEEETKIGEWIELSDGFWNKSQVTYSRKYVNGKKINRWNILVSGKLIGGGQYGYQESSYGIKQGKWIELDDGFYDSNQITYRGEYKNSIKIGKWDIIFRDSNVNQDIQMQKILFQIIKSAVVVFMMSNHQIRKELKQGAGLRLVMGFMITYKGEYQNGKKVGRWDIYFKDLCMDNNIYIGGGSFEIQSIGDSIKRGKWQEPDDKFRSQSQIIQIGEYKDGQKVGLWQIYQENIFQQKRKQIGGGIYIDKNGCQGIKIGLWIDLSRDFWKYGQITFQGVYRNGKKVGKWDNNFIDDFNMQNYQIGGGSYDNQQDNIEKNGNWIVLCDQFQMCRQIIYKGEYTNGKKVGRWLMHWRWNGKLKKIGGGQYDNLQGEGGVKVGKWTFVDDKFNSGCQVTHKGGYQNGKKVGKWDIYYREDQKVELLGGGFYDYKLEGDEIKIGKWIDLSDTFRVDNQIIYCGDYKDCKKVGRWDIFWRMKRNLQFQFIGGGSYDTKQQAEVDVKIGKWIELSEDLKNYSQIIYEGVYRNGYKIGKWNIQRRYYDEIEFKTMQVILIKYKYRGVQTYDN
ncbi:unnamed protein product [Paramecium primaurelia]|uniref:Uncharacterized protein n=1 Tax=Paramecium primaurelia TaxID=5886 RepID=A0A8S1Q494_PARPR|nr:unnamed protein product [Paramecium primaurelia]